MEKYRRYNLTHDDVLNHVSTILQVNKPYFAGIDIRGVSIVRCGTWQNALCLLRAYLAEAPPELAGSLRYEEVHLLESQMDTGDLLDFLQHITEGQMEIDGETVSLGPNTEFSEWSLVPGKNDYDDLPGYLYQSTRASSAYMDSDPLVHYALPYYPDVYHAIQDWIGLRQFHHSSDARVGTILLFLPECRAHFARMVSSDGCASICIEVGEGYSPNGLRLKGGWTIPGGFRSISTEASTGAVELEIPKGATGFELYLIGPSGDVFDYHRETSFWSLGHDRVLGAWPEGRDDSVTLVQQALQSGERETIEFKPYMRLGDPKMNELIETVIAFANTKGGVILLGVDDHCSVIGIEKELSKKPSITQGPDDDVYRQYEGDLRQAINRVLNRTISLEMQRARLESHTVLVVHVPEGSEKPYANRQTKEIFIRRGANNVRPDPDYELPQLYRADAGINGSGRPQQL